MNTGKINKLSTLTSKIQAATPICTESMLMHYLEYVRQATNAANVSWFAGYQGRYANELWKAELLDGWKIMEHVMLEIPVEIVKPDKVMSSEEAQTEYFKKAEKEYYEKASERGVDPMTQHIINSAGQTRTHRIIDIEVDLSEHWVKTEYRSSLGVGDRMTGVFNLDAEAESYLIVDRALGDEPFSQDNENELYRCLVEFPRVHDWLFLERGLLAEHKNPLSPRHRQLIPMLLAGMSEKDIASEIGRAFGTTHNYISDIYDIYAVKSRAELSSLWIRDLK
ncbi:MAG: hypothetical protein KAT04_11320 [Methylococcales bacterium]|nr:hypothetical protein [Methylococcales bacterium]